MDAKRIDVERARGDVNSGNALLVCAYDDDERSRKFHLNGALSLNEFERQAASLPKDREIIFYCA